MAKRRQIFKRSRTEAESRGLIGGREIDGEFMIWAVRPEDGEWTKSHAATMDSVTPA